MGELLRRWVASFLGGLVLAMLMWWVAVSYFEQTDMIAGIIAYILTIRIANYKYVSRETIDGGGMAFDSCEGDCLGVSGAFCRKCMVADGKKVDHFPVDVSRETIVEGGGDE